ncbi:hypothetical protein B0H10DRAFT_2194778 [Mycena sp. CBHHK59/15]|nr:hypothetical protein B0H10DRAFT_2194778 [Mycena sp. CBHHK59/15]
MKQVLKTWKDHPQGEKLHIWALGSDRDAAHLAKHLICMIKEVDRHSPLGKCVHSLLGMNCFTSKDGQLSTGDPKHIFKRMSPSTRIYTELISPAIGDATLLRNSGGIMVGKTNIQPDDIVQHLAALPDITLEKAKTLLDLSDKQTSQRLFHWCSIWINFDPSPCLLGLVTFRPGKLSTSSLKFLAILPLYSDSQAVINNIIFTIVRMQIIVPNLKFYIILEGTDRLEVVFGDCQTQDRAQIFDIEQLAGKLGIGALINAVFQRNPDLDQGITDSALVGPLALIMSIPNPGLGMPMLEMLIFQRDGGTENLLKMLCLKNTLVHLVELIFVEVFPGMALTF